jgi:hypothetical protein
VVDLLADFNEDDLEDFNRVRKHLDASSFQLTKDPNNPRIGIIRTSDRITFKQCRRKWGWSSHLRHNLGPKHGISPLWFGTGIHFALEDFHGYNRFGHPKAAFDGFVEASKRHFKDRTYRLPDDVAQLVELGHQMLDYYIIWMQQRIHSYGALKTLWIDGVPQVEVNFRFRIPGDYSRFGYDEVYYSGTIDRVCIDEAGLLWPIDYKTAKNIEIMHFLTDPQISAYMWAVPHLYKHPIGGFGYLQLRKSLPNPGRILQNGHVSTAQNQGTNYYMYRQTLIQVYGSVDRSPEPHQIFLNNLLMGMDEWKDDVIQFDRIGRNERHGMSEGAKILLEVEEMLNPDLPLYPNPTRMCAHWQYPCSFLSACTSLDDGSDWVHELEMTTEPREEKYDTWRDFLVYPGDPNPDDDRRVVVDRSWLEGLEDLDNI